MSNSQDKKDSVIETRLNKELKDEEFRKAVEDKEGFVSRPFSRRAIRSLAFHFLYAADRFDYTVPLNQIVENFEKGFDLNIPEDSSAIIMAEGTIQERSELDEQIRPLLKNWKLERLGCCTRLILRMALWELSQPYAIPSVVINEAIELAKAFAEKDAYKFINGILDEACKRKGLIIEQKQGEVDDKEE